MTKKLLLTAILLLLMTVGCAAQTKYEYVQQTGSGDIYFDTTTAAASISGNVTTISAKVMIRLSDAARTNLLEKLKVHASVFAYDVVYKIKNFNNERNELSKKFIKATLYDAAGKVIDQRDMGGKLEIVSLDSPDWMTATAIFIYCETKKQTTAK